MMNGTRDEWFEQFVNPTKSVLRILVFLIQILILIPDSRVVYDLIFTLFILLTLSR